MPTSHGRALCTWWATGPARESLQALAAQLLPAGAFTFHGYLPDADVASRV